MCELHCGPGEYCWLKAVSGQKSLIWRCQPAEGGFDRRPVVVAFDFHSGELDSPNEFTQIAVITRAWLANRLIRCSNEVKEQLVWRTAGLIRYKRKRKNRRSRS